MRAPAPDFPNTASARPIIVWFREDLRLADNPALHAATELAAEDGATILCVFVLDEDSPGLRRRGGASRWWLHGSLSALAENLRERGADLLLLRGSAGTVIGAIAEECGAQAVFWNRRYGGAERLVDSDLKAALEGRHIDVREFEAKLLQPPWATQTKSAGPFRVFTPFWRAAQVHAPDEPLPAPGRIPGAPLPEGDALADWNLTPCRPDWAGGLRAAWRPGEAAALDRLRVFLDIRLDRYAAERDYPAKEASSSLSPHLAFGEIGPRQIWSAARHRLEAVAPENLAKLQSEIGWREFGWHMLFHDPDLAVRNFNPAFDRFQWAEPGQALAAWQQGRTGYPIVDAAMRQLWQTGWMHNRLRLIAGSFLVKDLLIDWRHGEAWFWDTLVDADAASNAVNWQWVAGSGADAAPYFRIFNPVLQGRRFDPEGAFIRQYMPELAALSDRHIHEPWRAPGTELAAAGVRLGETYPLPIVDHGFARARALAAFAAMRAA